MKNNFQFIPLEIRHGGAEKSSIRKSPEETAPLKNIEFALKKLRGKTFGMTTTFPSRSFEEMKEGGRRKTRRGKTCLLKSKSDTRVLFVVLFFFYSK